MEFKQTEIGGYMSLDTFDGKEFYPNLLKLNSGRNALCYIIQTREIQTIYLPYYLCGVIESVCKDLSVKVINYHIDSEFKPLIDTEAVKGDEWIYLVNYYGQLSDEQIVDIYNKHKNIIIDNAQAFFCRPLKNIITLYTCRKFFGVPDGAYVAVPEKDALIFLDRDYSTTRYEYVLGRFEKTANEYYHEYKKNELIIDELPLKKMSLLTMEFLKKIDYEMTKIRRTSNFIYLNKFLKNSNLLQLKIAEGAYAYPYKPKDIAKELRKKLIDKKIYVPILWPSNDFAGTSELSQYSEDILPLPCDQRYTEKEMKYIVDTINDGI